MDQVDATTQYLAYMGTVLPGYPLVHALVKPTRTLPSAQRALNAAKFMAKHDGNMRSIKAARRSRGLF